MPFAVKFTIPRLPKNLLGGNARKIIRKNSLKLANTMAIRMRQDFFNISPLGATALLKGSWKITKAKEVPKGVIAVVSSSEISAFVWDRGTKTNPRVHSRKLEQWVRRKLDVISKRDIDRAAFVVARAIRKRGLPRPARRNLIGLFTKRAKRLERTTFNQMGKRAVNDIIEELSR